MTNVHERPPPRRWPWIPCLLVVLALASPLPTAAAEADTKPSAAPSTMPSTPPSTAASSEAAASEEASKAAPAAAVGPEPLPAAAAPTRVPDIDGYRDRVDNLMIGRFTGDAAADAADRLFWEIDRAIWPFQRDVQAAALANDPEIVQRHDELVQLYGLRDELFPLVSADLRAELVGPGPIGVTALRHELGYLRTLVLSQLRVIAEGLRYGAANVSDSPFRTTWLVIQAGILIFAFRAWRRWSKSGIKKARMRLLAIRPRQASNLHLARMLWYLDRVGQPLAWLFLVMAFSYLVQPKGFEELASLVFTVLVWVLVARFVVELIDAMVARGVGGLRSERASLRLRSLRLIGGAMVGSGLGLSLVARYAGHGALYSWALFVTRVLGVLVVLLLIHWWRDEIARRLEARADESAWARRLSAGQGSLVRWVMTIAGAGYLVWVAVQRWMLRRISGWDQGRRILALLVRREVERDGEAEHPDDESPIPQELVEKLLAPPEKDLESVDRSQLDELCAALAFRTGGAYVVMAERGGGKSRFIHRLAERIGDDGLVVECPAEGYDGLAIALAEGFGVDVGDDPDEALAAAIDASPVQILCIDDAHRLTRPYMGGQLGMDRLARLDGRLNRKVTWVLGIDRRAWRFIQLARAERILVQRVVELPPWSEEELAELIQSRARAAGIDPDYRRIVLPAQLDSGEYESLNERNRHGHARIVWELSDGIPAAAIRLFITSIRALPDGRIVARLPQTVFSVALNEASVETLLVLRVILQSEFASAEDVSKSLRLSPARTHATIRYCEQNGWIEELDARYRIAWGWYRTITRALTRSNLMTR